MNRIEIGPAYMRDASYVCANLNDMDRAEAFCQLPDSMKTHELAWGLLEGSEAWTAFWKGRPVAIFGTAPIHVSALSVWMLGTDRSWRVAVEVVRFFKQDIGPRRVVQGYRTMEARTWERHTAAHGWMEGAGARRWTPPFEYGKNGERFVIYGWTAEAFRRHQ